MQITLKNRQNADIVIDIIDIFLKFLVLSIRGLRKSKYPIPEKLNKLLKPEKNVLLTPYPNIGNILSGIKSFIEDINIIIILSKIIGINIKFTFDKTFNEKRFAIILQIIKNNNIYKVGDERKYINFNVSEKFFITKTGTSNNNKK